jgi:acyl dehydratase
MNKIQSNDYTYEDAIIGEPHKLGSCRLEADEIKAFAKRWDPMPFHIDEDLAAASPFGGLTASGTHLLAIRIGLLQRPGINQNVLASFGYEEVKFLQPARVGDTLTLFVECVWKRESESRPGHGMTKWRHTLENQDDEIVLSMLDTILIKMAGG